MPSYKVVVVDGVSGAAGIVATMDAAVWTAIGLMATFSLGSVFYLGSRIDSLAARMDARFGSMESRFGSMESRFDAMDARFDMLSARMDTRFDGVDARLDAVNARIDAHLDRHAG